MKINFYPFIYCKPCLNKIIGINVTWRKYVERSQWGSTSIC